MISFALFINLALSLTCPILYVEYSLIANGIEKQERVILPPGNNMDEIHTTADTISPWDHKANVKVL